MYTNISPYIIPIRYFGFDNLRAACIVTILYPRRKKTFHYLNIIIIKSLVPLVTTTIQYIICAIKTHEVSWYGFFFSFNLFYPNTSLYFIIGIYKLSYIIFQKRNRSGQIINSSPLYTNRYFFLLKNRIYKIENVRMLKKNCTRFFFYSYIRHYKTIFLHHCVFYNIKCVPITDFVFNLIKRIWI